MITILRNNRFAQFLARIWNKVLLKARLSSMKRVHFGVDSVVESGCNLCDVTFGRHSFAGYNCEIYDTIIGSFCSIGNNVIINPGIHPLNWVSTSPVFYEGKESVKANCKSK